MVGHTGSYLATLISVETVDLQVGRLLKAAQKKQMQFLSLQQTMVMQKKC